VNALTCVLMFVCVCTPQDTLRQLLMAQLTPAHGAQPGEVHAAIDTMLRGLRQAREGEGVDGALLEAINRSISEAQSQQAPPAAVKVVENLPRRKWNKSDEEASDECAICLSKYDDGDELSVLPCTHQLHTECLAPWLKQTNSCPLCRHQLGTDSSEYEASRRQHSDSNQGSLAEEGQQRASAIRADVSSSLSSPAGGSAAAGRSAFSSEFGVPGPAVAVATSSPASFSSGGSRGSPASRARQTPGVMRRGFLQERGARGFGEDPSVQQTVGGGIEGVTGIREVPRQHIRGVQPASGYRMLRMPGVVLSTAVDRSVDSGYSWSPAAAPASRRDAESKEGGNGGGAHPRVWSVRKLKAVLRNAHVLHEDCVEKEDLVRRCLESRTQCDLAAVSRDYDARLAAGAPDAGATRVPRSSPSASFGSPGNPTTWSPTTSAAASVLSDDWLQAGGRDHNNMRTHTRIDTSPLSGIAGGVGGARLPSMSNSSPLGASRFYGDPDELRGVASGGAASAAGGMGGGIGVARLDSLLGRSPVQERNTASHNYSRLPRRDSLALSATFDRADSGASVTNTFDPAHAENGGRRPSSRNLYQRPNTNRQGAGDSSAASVAAPGEAAGGESVAAAGAASSIRRGSGVAGGRAGGESESGGSENDAAGGGVLQARRQKYEGGSVEGAGGNSPSKTARRIRLRASTDKGALAAHAASRTSSAHDTAGRSLPNSRGNQAVRQTSEEELLRPGTGGHGSEKSPSKDSGGDGGGEGRGSRLARPGSSAGLRPRTPSSSSWRPVISSDAQNSSSEFAARYGSSSSVGGGDDFFVGGGGGV